MYVQQTKPLCAALAPGLKDRPASDARPPAGEKHSFM